VILVKKLLLSKTQEIFLFVLALRDLIQHQTMIVRIVSQIVKLVQMQYHATLANQHPPKQWHECFQIVNALQIMQVSQILIVHLSVWLNVRPALTWYLVILVKKLHLNKILESYPFALALRALFQHQTMIVQIVSQIVKLVRMQPPATLANQHPPRLWLEFCLPVNVLYIMGVNQIMTVYLV
jgi:hypothetical protein